MIGISKLYCGTVEPSDALRYGRHSSRLPSHLLQFSEDKRPVVVWNVTRRCNLKCVHCYAHAEDKSFANELSTSQGRDLIDDLAGFGAPVLLFSGGEPLVRKDLPELAEYAVQKECGRHFHQWHSNNPYIGPDTQRDWSFLCGDQPGRNAGNQRPVPRRQWSFRRGVGRHPELPVGRN